MDYYLRKDRQFKKVLRIVRAIYVAAGIALVIYVITISSPM